MNHLLKRAALAVAALLACLFAAPALAADCATGTTPNTLGTTANAAYEATVKVCNAFADVRAVAFTPTVSAAPAYTSGDVMGGLLTFATATRQAGGDGLIQSVTVHFKTAQTAPADFFWCNSNPLASTTLTDNAALAVNAADFAACRVVHVTDCTSMGASGPTVCQAENLALPYGLATGTTGYGFLVTRGAPTLGSTSDVAVSVRFLRNN
jgi:hypothetical protein